MKTLKNIIERLEKNNSQLFKIKCDTNDPIAYNSLIESNINVIADLKAIEIDNVSFKKKWNKIVADANLKLINNDGPEKQIQELMKYL